MSDDDIATTRCPNALANFKPIVPRPPIPITPTVFFTPLVYPQCYKGLYIVTPAHMIGPTVSKGRLSGILTTKCSLTTLEAEYPPNVRVSGLPP